MNAQRAQSMRGLTIVEVTIVIGVILVAGVVFSLFQRDFFRFNFIFQQSLINQQQGRAALEEIFKELRAAGPAENGAYPIALADGNTFAVYVNIDMDMPRERVRYFVENSALKKGVIEPVGSPAVYNPATENIRTLLRDVAATSTPLFTYYDRNFAGTSSPLTLPVDISLIRLIKITLVIDRDISQLPEPLVLTSQVFLRNLKDN